MSLEPIQLQVDLKKSLSAVNNRINVPSTFTLALDTDPVMLNTAAERLLGLAQSEIEKLASEIIFGQLRQVVAHMKSGEFSQDRENDS